MADLMIFGKEFSTVVQFLLSGILVGGLYALVALGIVVINKASGVFNFAHGWMMFIGGLMFWQFYANQPSRQMTFILSGTTALLVLGVISSIGLGVKTAATAERPTPKFEEEGVKMSRLTVFWDKVNGFIADHQMLVAIVIGVGIWMLTGYMFTQDSEPILRGAVGAFVACIILGLFIERFTIRPLLGQPLLTAILMTLAVGFILQGAIQIVWGVEGHSVDIFKEPSRPNVIQVAPGVFREVGTVGGETLPNYKIETASWLGKDLSFQRDKTWGFGISVITFIAFALLFQYTSVGLAMRATAENQVLAESVGLRVRLILAVAWALVAVMAGIAGVLQGTAASLTILTVPLLALRVFPAVLLGGLDSITGAFVGGIILGIVENMTTLYANNAAGTQFAPYLVLMIVLLIRPEGLFGQHRIDRV